MDELEGDYDYNYEDELHTCDSLCHSDYIRFSDKCVCGNGNIYYEGSAQLYYESYMTDDNYYRCKVFCDLCFKYNECS